MTKRPVKKQANLKLIKYGTVEGFIMSNIKGVMSKEAFVVFTKWIYGQTLTIYKGEDLVYLVDLVRFIKRLLFSGAEGGSRTHMVLRPSVFETLL